MVRRRAVVLGFVLGLISISPLAKANILTSAAATANCQGYTLTVSATELTVNQTYTINYSFTATCGSSSPVTVPGSVTFIATSSTLMVTASGTFGSSEIGNCSVTGTATLTSSGSTVSINVNGLGTATMSCPSSAMLGCEAGTGTVGIPYNSGLVASGGVPPYTFSGFGGGPGGLTLNPTTGAIFGIPIIAGTYTDFWTVVDSASPPNTAFTTCTLTIVPPLPSNLKLACEASTGTIGIPYNSGVGASGGVPPYIFAGFGGGPGGLTLNPNTGAIFGTPINAGTYTDFWTVSDSASPPNSAETTCTLTISATPPPACVIPPSGTAIAGAPVSWNGFNAPAGSVVWVNAHISAPGNVSQSTTTTVDFTGVTLVVNTTSYALPNGHVIFNPATTTPSTVVNADGSWTTTVNPSTSGDIFFMGQAISVDSTLENGGHGNTGSTLSFSTSSSDASLTFQWQWSAAVYTSWPGNAVANIEPVHGALQAGAPQNKAVQATLIQGPRGGGGSNFTGSWSGTGKGTCPH